MKLLFVHDGTLKYDENRDYFGIAVNPITLKRYKHMSNDITILIRTVPFSKGESKHKYTKIPSEYKIVNCSNYMSLKGMLIDRKIVKQTVKELVAEVDLVIARFSGETGKIAARECSKTGTPYIVESVGCSWDAYWNYGLKGKLIAPYMYLSTRHLIKNAPYVIYVTNDFLQRRYPSRGKWIAASNVELIDMDQEALNKRIKKIESKSSEDAIILGTAAAVDVPYKGHKYVIEAIAKLNKAGFNIKYQILGAGDQAILSNVAQKFGVEDSVEFLGVKPHSQVFKWIDEIDIYVQPSDTEGLPRALIEAMSRACPAIGSSTAGIPELLDTTCVFKRKHVSELVEVLQIMNKTKMIEQASINYNMALEYQRDNIYKRRNSFFDMVVDEIGSRENK